MKKTVLTSIVILMALACLYGGWEYVSYRTACRFFSQLATYDPRANTPPPNPPSLISNKTYAKLFFHKDVEIRNLSLMSLKTTGNIDPDFTPHLRRILLEELDNNVYETASILLADGSAENTQFLTEQFLDNSGESPEDYLKLKSLLESVMFHPESIDFQMFRSQKLTPLKDVLVNIMEYQLLETEEAYTDLEISFFSLTKREQMTCVFFCADFPTPATPVLFNFLVKSESSKVKGLAFMFDPEGDFQKLKSIKN